MCQRIRKRVKESKRVGYCHCAVHEGSLTVQALREHNCVGKKCKYLEKNEDNPYWTECERNAIKKELIDFYNRNIIYMSSKEFLRKVKKHYTQFENIKRVNGHLQLDEFLNKKTIKNFYLFHKE